MKLVLRGTAAASAICYSSLLISAKEERGDALEG